jgi:hypothetical protein
MVTATTGQATFKGLQTGKIYTPSIYISDVAAALITWNMQGAAAAGSSNQIQFTEDVQLIDIAIISGPTVISGFYWSSAYIPVPSSNQLISTIYTTIQTRSFTPQAFKAGRIVQATQF